MDNASYHSRKLEAIPTTGWRKDKIKEWLKSKNINFDEDCLKRDLYKVREVREKYENYRIDEIAKKKTVALFSDSRLTIVN
jgi:hypothetical protein